MKLDTNKPYRMLVCGQLLQEINRRQEGTGDRIPPQLINAVERAVNTSSPTPAEGVTVSRCYSEHRGAWLKMLEELSVELEGIERLFFTAVPKKFPLRTIHNCFRKAIRLYNDALSNARNVKLRLYRHEETGSVIAAYNKPFAIYYGTTVSMNTTWTEITSTADIEDICTKALDNPHVAFRPFSHTSIATCTRMGMLGGLDY